jgi:hypothetical protein
VRVHGGLGEWIQCTRDFQNSTRLKSLRRCYHDHARSERKRCEREKLAGTGEAREQSRYDAGAKKRDRDEPYYCTLGFAVLADNPDLRRSIPLALDSVSTAK